MPLSLPRLVGGFPPYVLAPSSGFVPPLAFGGFEFRLWLPALVGRVLVAVRMTDRSFFTSRLGRLAHQGSALSACSCLEVDLPLARGRCVLPVRVLVGTSLASWASLAS